MYMEEEIDHLIDIALAEDLGSNGDITSQVCIPEHSIITGRFIMKQAGVICGLPFLEMLYRRIDEEIKITLYEEEGNYLKAGAIVAKVSGPAQGILAGERVALNLIQHASGIATITKKFVKKVVGLKCEILDTRKTSPGLRGLEKYAVRVGGGSNHRYSLDDRFIIKRNHCYFLSGKTQHPIRDAVKMCRENNPDLPIEVEIDDIKHLSEALDTEAGAIMLSRMMPNVVERCLKQIRKTNKKVYIESHGTITLDTIRAYAETGVDGISIGSITHSVQALDIVMRLK